MKKIFIILFLVIGVQNISIAQTTNDDISFILEGKCCKVLEYIVKQTNNDSIAVKYFLDNYIIISNPINQINLNQKGHKYIIDFFKKPFNKDIWCKRKEFNNYSLIIDSTDF